MTTYAHVNGQTITVGLPESVDGPDGLVCGLTADTDPKVLAALGYHPVTTVLEPLGVDQHHGPPVLTFDGSTVTSTHPAVDDPVEQVNQRTIEARARAALTANRDFLANQSVNNAAVVAQVRMLTRECSALIRLMLSELDGTD